MLLCSTIDSMQILYSILPEVYIYLRDKNGPSFI